MPKKKVTREVSRDKFAFMLRFDEELHERVRLLAETAQISVNQLMQGLARWAVQNARQGEPYRDQSGKVQSRAQPGCLWFGEVASKPLSLHDCEEIAAHYGGEPEEYLGTESPGNVIFSLDFTERHVVRDELDERPSQRPPVRKAIKKRP